MKPLSVITWAALAALTAVSIPHANAQSIGVNFTGNAWSK